MFPDRKIKQTEIKVVMCNSLRLMTQEKVKTILSVQKPEILTLAAHLANLNKC